MPQLEIAGDRRATDNPKARPIAITNVVILTASGKRFAPGTIVLEGGAISYVGDGHPTLPDGTTEIDGTGKFVTPGLIDPHSHIGVWSLPGVRANADTNEATAPNTAEVAVEYAYSPQDPSISRALAAGVTTALILPGSANLIGGRGLTVVMRPGRTAAEVAFPGAPPTLKMACGENPKGVYGEKGGPMTRMGMYAGFRAAFQKAAEYRTKRALYHKKRAAWLKAREDGGKPEPAPEPVPIDAQLETLAGVLDGKVLPEVHCYRAVEMAQLIEIADQFGFAIRAFHHALEAYKLRDVLAARGIATVTWPDWWGFKMESLDGILENAALVTSAGGRATMHSDSPIEIQLLNQDAAKAMYAGRRAGLDISEDQALRWITAEPAWVIGIDQVTGTLETGKRADVVLWDHHPFSVYARPELVIEAGEIAYRRQDGLPPADFELGNSAVAPLPAAPGGAR